MSVTLQDIAARVKLSRATVSFVLNNRRDVAIPEATRQKVLKAAEEMGYKPNKAARALVMGTTQLVAVLVPETLMPLHSYMIRRIHQRALEAGYELVVRHHDAAHAKQVGWPVDGSVLIDCDPDTPEKATSCVYIGTIDSFEGDFVGVDAEKAVHDSVIELANHDCKRIAFCVPDHEAERHDGRFLGYTKGMEAHGYEQELIPVPCATLAEVREFITQYLSKKGCPDALICCDDYMAIAANKAVKDYALCCPDDTQIVSYGGLEISEYSDPPISTIRIPYDQMSELAWEFLGNRISNPAIDIQKAMLQAELIWRGSTSVTPTAADKPNQC